MAPCSYESQPPGRPTCKGRLAGLIVGLALWSSFGAQAAPPAGPPPVPGPEAVVAPDGLPARPSVPASDQVFQAENERQFLQSILPQLAKTTGSKEVPPDAPAGPPVAPVPPPAEAQVETVVPHVLCYLPLYFEQKRPEREGRRIILLQPLISTGHFYLDVAALPVKVVLWPPWHKECNTDDPSWGAAPVPPRGAP